LLQGPVWVCTTNDALDDVVLRAVAPSQRQQLVFLQNGMLLPWLTAHGLQHNTQVLLYMSGELAALETSAW
jgi:ABC-type taurine transport system ATPase subunit